MPISRWMSIRFTFRNWTRLVVEKELSDLSGESGLAYIVKKSPTQRGGKVSETIESLLQENMGQVEQIDGLASEMLSEAGRLNDFSVGSLSDTISLGGDTCDALEKLREDLHRATEEVETTAQGTRNNLSLLNDQMQHCEEQLSVQTAELRAVTTGIREASDQVRENAETLTQRAHSVLSSVGESSAATATTLNGSAEAAESQIDAVATGITDKISQMEDRATAVIGAIAELKSSCDEKSSDFETSIEEAADACDEKVAENLAAFDEAASGTIEKIDQVLSSDAGELLISSSGDLGEVLGKLQELVGGGGGDFTESIGEVLDSIQEVVDMVEKIKPVLDLVQKML